jgi:alpha-beta hydrolase superfamily lysophospholipase
MTITESVHSILASDAEPIRMYKWSGSAPARGIIQIEHGMGEHALRYRPIAHALVSAGYTVYTNDHRVTGSSPLRPMSWVTSAREVFRSWSTIWSE